MATKLGTLTLDLVAKTGNYTQGMGSAADSTKKFANQSKSELDKLTASMTSTERAAGAMATIFKTALAGVSIAQLTSMADGYTQTAARIRNATDSTAEYDLVQRRLFETANSTYRALGEAQEVYLGLAGGMKSLGYATKDTLDVADSLSFSFVANAARADQAQSAIDSFSKAMAKGKVDADAWISIVSAADNVIADMAKTTGMSESQIRKLGAEGKISLEDLIKTLKVTRDQNKELADSMENSLADGFTKLTNGITRYVGELNMAMGVTGGAAGLLGELGDNIETIANLAMVAAAGYAGSYIPAIVLGTAATVRNTIATISDTAATKAKVIADYNLARSELAATAAMVRATGATNAQTAAMVANARAAYQKAAATKAAMLSSQSLVAALTGPVGVGIAVASVAAGYLLLRNNSKQVESALITQGKTVAELTEEYRKLDTLQRDIALRKLEEDFKGLKEESDEAQLSLYQFTEEVRRNSGVSKAASLEAQRLFQEYNAGKLKAGQFYELMKDLNIMTDKQTEKFMDLANAHSTAKAKFVESSVQIKALTSENEKLAKSQDASANAANRQASGIANSAEAAAKASAAMKSLADRQRDNEYILKNYKVLGGMDAARAALRFKEELGVDSSVAFNAEQRKVFDAWLQSENAVKNLNKEISESTKKQTKSVSDLTKSYEKLAEVRDQIKYQYANVFEQDNIDLDNEMDRIRKAGFSPQHEKAYIDAALSRAKFNQDLYVAEQEFEINQHRYTEDQKLEKEHEVNLLRINANYALNDQLLQAYLDSESEKHKKSIAWMRLEQNMRLNDASQAFQTEMQNIAAKYEFERQQIILNSQLSKDERDALISASRITESIDSAKGRDAALYGLLGASGIDTSVEQAAAQRAEAFQAALDWQLITQEEYQQKMLESESQYYRAKAALGLQDAANTTAGMANLMGALLGEQSAGYKAMFAMAKAFAIAKVIMNAPETFSNVYNSVAAIPYVGPYLAPVMAGGALAVQLSQAASIRSMSLTGIAHSGIDDIPEEGTWLLNKGERVLSPRQNSDLTRYLNERQSSNGDGVNVNINVPSGYTANESRDGNGNVTIDIVEKVVKQAFGNLNQANSFESKQIRNNFNVGRVR
ncbi:tape measure protein [Acinetobacter haemolyticus]|uniref:tape measure protein n=1 Tax=Acinetobacter haemolyticus TaxID=29430 RepID=UPI0034D3BBB1